MQTQCNHAISQGSWRLVTFLVCTAILLLFVLQLRMDFNLYQQQQQESVASLLNLAEPSAKLAIEFNDAQLAKQLVDQLLEQPAITQASINSADSLLANGKHSSVVSANTLPTSWFMDIISEQRSILVSETTGQTGQLAFSVNNHQLYSAFYQQALQQLLVLLGMVLGVILFVQHLAKKRIRQPFEILKKTFEQSQQRLATSQSTLSKINYIETFGSWSYDTANNLFHWDGELAAILGVNADTITGIEDIFTKVATSHQEQLATTIANASTNQQFVDIEIPLQHSDSTLLWVRAIGRCQLVNNTPVWVEGLLQDISSTQTSQHDLQLRDFALNQSPDSIFTLDANGCILTVNDTACRNFGYLRDELLGQTVDLLNRKFDMTDWPRWWEAVKSQKHHTSFADNQTKTGLLFPVEVAASYFAYHHQELCILSVKDITERKKHEDAIQHLAYHDSLTSLPNRRLLLDRLHQALISARRHKHIGALLFIDLDNFKKINESQGHSGGDQVLKTLAARITGHLRAEDTVARIGGDEFVVLLPLLSHDEVSAKQRAEDLANKLLNLVTRPITTDDQPFQVTASIGVVNFPNNSENGAEELISFADTAMYQAKEKGRNGVVYFEMSMAEDVSRQINLESRLRTVLENDELYLHFQPQYKGPHQLIGAEVLMRWNAPTFGIIPPSEFIPIMESSGLILEVGEWLMRQACLQLKHWLDHGLWDTNLTLGINISPVEFEQPHFVGQVAVILKETGVPAQCIDIEITEGTVINNIEQIIETLEALRALGVKISIDDFGTGYSSLTYLKRLPIDMVKINQSFVRDIPGDDSAGAIINTIISMAEHLNLDIIAEGIESIEQIHYLEANNCKKFQGFYFHRPMPEADFTLLLTNNLQSEPLHFSRLN